MVCICLSVSEPLCYVVQVRKLRHPNIVAALKHATVINQVRSCSL